jgi:hypothetical protein
MEISENLELVRLKMSYRPLTNSFHFTIQDSPGSNNMVTSYDSPYEVKREEYLDYMYEWVVDESGNQHFTGMVCYGGNQYPFPFNIMIDMPTKVRRMAIQFVGLATKYFENLASASDDFVNITSLLTHELAIEFKEIRRSS